MFAGNVLTSMVSDPLDAVEAPVVFLSILSSCAAQVEVPLNMLVGSPTICHVLVKSSSKLAVTVPLAVAVIVVVALFALAITTPPVFVQFLNL